MGGDPQTYSRGSELSCGDQTRGGAQKSIFEPTSILLPPALSRYRPPDVFAVALVRLDGPGLYEPNFITLNI